MKYVEDFAIWKLIPMNPTKPEQHAWNAKKYLRWVSLWSMSFVIQAFFATLDELRSYIWKKNKYFPKDVNVILQWKTSWFNCVMEAECQKQNTNIWRSQQKSRFVFVFIMSASFSILVRQIWVWMRNPICLYGIDCRYVCM